jgi:hypothetical protein
MSWCLRESVNILNMRGGPPEEEKSELVQFEGTTSLNPSQSSPIPVDVLVERIN